MSRIIAFSAIILVALIMFIGGTIHAVQGELPGAAMCWLSSLATIRIALKHLLKPELEKTKE